MRQPLPGRGKTLFPNWSHPTQLLVGDGNDYFVEENLGLEKAEDDFLHTENFVLIDKNSHIRGIYNGLNSAAISQLIADIRSLQQEL